MATTVLANAQTPGPTRAGLIATLAITLAALADFARRAGDGVVEPRVAGWFLLLFSALFLLRVLGQVSVLLRGPAWLPPMSDWNLMPYPLLLPIQAGFLVAMGWIVHDLLQESGTLATRHPSLGRFALWLGVAYGGAMAVRYVVRMSRRPEARWFGGAIPIVFHWVLAAFVLVFGAYHAGV